MEEARSLHCKFKVTLSRHIGVQEDELKQLICRFGFVLNQDDVKSISDTYKLLDCLERNKIFKVGDYDKLMKIISEFDNRIVEIGHPVSVIIEEIMNIFPRRQDESNAVTLGDDVPNLMSNNELENGKENDTNMITGDKEVFEISNNQLKKRKIQSDNDLQPLKRPMLIVKEQSSTLSIASSESDLQFTQKNDNEQQLQIVDDILQSLGLEKYIEKFKDEEIDIDAFWTLTDEHLQSLQLPVGARSKLMNYIKEHKESRVTSCSYNGDIKLYPHQEELAKRALNGENTIVFSRTNSGKTYIAFRVILNHLQKVQDGKVLFTANTNILCCQQCGRASEILKDPNISICSITSEEDRTDYTLYNMFKSHNVFFMTPQLLVNNIKRNDEKSVHIDDFTLLVFDECHHTMGFSSYNNIMAFYRRKKFNNERPEKKLPQVLGLTASPGIYKAKTVESAARHVKTLMANLDVFNLSTVVKETSDYAKYFDEPQKETITATLRNDDVVIKLLANVLEKIEMKITTATVQQNLHHFETGQQVWKMIEEHPSLPDRLSGRYHGWCRGLKDGIEHLDISKVSEEFQNDAKELQRFLHSSFRHIEVYLEAFYINNDLDYADVRSYIQTELECFDNESKAKGSNEERVLVAMMSDVINNIPNQTESYPDLLQLIQILEKEYHNKHFESRFMVFVRTRMIAKIIADRLPKELLACYLTGSSASDEKGGLSRDDQMEVLEKFKLGMHRCIVATSVAFEGIDIKQCNLAVNYKIEASDISSIQMKGRIRRNDGKQYILGTNKQIRKETINVERQLLMAQAVNFVLTKSNASPEDLRNDLENIQKAVHVKEELRKESTQNIQIEGRFEVHCRKCYQIICEGEFLRKFDVHHAVIDIDIIQRITKGPLKKEKKNFDDGFIKKWKAYGPCGHDWGVIMEKHIIDFLILAQDSVKLYNVKDSQYVPKMKKCPFVIVDITMDDVKDYKNKLKESNYA